MGRPLLLVQSLDQIVMKPNSFGFCTTRFSVSMPRVFFRVMSCSLFFSYFNLILVNIELFF